MFTEKRSGIPQQISSRRTEKQQFSAKLEIYDDLPSLLSHLSRIYGRFTKEILTVAAKTLIDPENRRIGAFLNLEYVCACSKTHSLRLLGEIPGSEGND
jgi:hypothetical protein